MQWVAWWRKLPFWGKQQVGLWCPMTPAKKRMARVQLEQFVALQNWDEAEYSAVILPRGMHPEKKTTIQPGEIPEGDYPLDWI